METGLFIGGKWVGGEACTAVNRFCVHASVASEFGQLVAARMAALTTGPGTAAETEDGPPRGLLDCTESTYIAVIW